MLPMLMLRSTDRSWIGLVLRLIGGVPILLIGLVHIFVADAGMQPIVEAAGLPFPGLLAPLAVAAEIVAGVSLILGWWARVGALIAIPVMAVAFVAHMVIEVWPNPTAPPTALPLIVLACAAYVLWRGAGRWSLDARASG